MIYYFYQKERILKNRLNCSQLARRKIICYRTEKFKTSKIYGLVLKKVQRVLQFNQKSPLKPYIYMKKELGKK